MNAETRTFIYGFFLLLFGAVAFGINFGNIIEDFKWYWPLLMPFHIYLMWQGFKKINKTTL